MDEAGTEDLTALQSTLPHGERLILLKVARLRGQASIHAPARGATWLKPDRTALCIGFNPRSRTGSDPKPFGPCLWVLCFNPRSRTGSDLVFQVHGLRFIRFNPRSRTGSDRTSSEWRPEPDTLQSTLPHGERPIPTSPRNWASRFNPRSRTGSDSSFRSCPRPLAALQSTLPHGERRTLDAMGTILAEASIHAPARGATGAGFALKRGCRLQSTLPHGERRRCRSERVDVVPASIHAPARGATGRV